MKRRTPDDAPKAIAAYRVREAPTDASGLAKVLPLKGAGEPFVTDVRRALAEMEAEAMATIGSGSRRPIPKLSVSSVTRRAGRGRSQVYGAFPYLVVEISDAEQRVRSAARSAGSRVPRSKESLSREARAAKSEAKRKVAVMASMQLAELVKRLGPELRRREKHVAEVAELRQRLEEAELAKKTLLELQKSWMVEANRRIDDD